MKKLILIFLTPIVFSCGGSSIEKSNSVNFNFSVDSVLVDAGEELIFHQSGLSHSDLSYDQKRLFNFTAKGELEVIHLDSLKLVHRIALEREGPLGVGRPYAIQFDPAGRLILYGLNEVRIVSPGLDSMERYLLAEDALSGLSPEVLAYFNPKIVEGNSLYAIYETHQQVPQGLAIVSLEENGVKKIPLELATRIEPYTYSFKSSSKGDRKSVV